jgi:hypothetical protein
LDENEIGMRQMEELIIGSKNILAELGTQSKAQVSWGGIIQTVESSGYEVQDMT